jgi:hypothetical protein
MRLIISYCFDYGGEAPTQNQKTSIVKKHREFRFLNVVVAIQPACKRPSTLSTLGKIWNLITTMLSYWVKLGISDADRR